jgi:signal transduction histidine kinase
MPGLFIIKKLRGVEFPLALSVILCAGIFFERSGVINFGWLIFTHLFILLSLLVYLLYKAEKRIKNLSIKASFFASAYFLVFSTFFIVMGQRDYIFYLFFFAQVIISSVFKPLIFPLLITSFYAIYSIYFATASKRHDILDLTLFSCFLIVAALSVVMRGGFAAKGLYPRIIRQRDSIATLHVISNAITSGMPVDKVISLITNSLGLFTNVARSSIILLDKDLIKGRIAASFEGVHLRNKEIEIEKYPEILKAIKTRKVVTIADIYRSPVTMNIRKAVKPINGQSVMVIPLKYGEENLGVLFLRGYRHGKGFSKEEVRFCETVATLSGQVLLTARLYEELKDKSEELRKTIGELEEANRMKSIFVANVSHELRTPLTSIIGYLQLLTDTGFSEEERLMHVETIKKNADMLLLLINELIDISKIEAGTFELFYEKSNLNNLVQFVCESLKPKLDRSGMRLDLKFKNFEEEFYFDVNRIEQVLNNILNNAIKFSRDGTNITIKTSFSENWAQVSIKDEGIGIKEDDQHRIFERFVQADASYVREKSGAGIGLHLCREIIAMHKGKIWVESHAGKGATFHFRIPLVTATQDLKGSLTIGLPEADA